MTHDVSCARPAWPPSRERPARRALYTADDAAAELHSSGFSTEPPDVGLPYHFAIKARRASDADTTPRED